MHELWLWFCHLNYSYVHGLILYDVWLSPIFGKNVSHFHEHVTLLSLFNLFLSSLINQEITKSDLKNNLFQKNKNKLDII